MICVKKMCSQIFDSHETMNHPSTLFLSRYISHGGLSKNFWDKIHPDPVGEDGSILHPSFDEPRF